MDPVHAQSDVGALSDTIQSLHKSETLTLDRGTSSQVDLLVTPAGRSVHSIKKFLDEYLEKPERRQGTAQAFTLLSLIALVNRFSTKESVVFADPNEDAPRFTAVFDYHPENGADDAKLPADWLKHRAVYEPQLSEDWEAWTTKDGEYMDQNEFARFIEDHMMQLVVANLDDPTLKVYSELAAGSFAAPTDLIRLSRGIEISASIAVKQATKLMSGEISVQYTETHTDGSGEPLRLPSLFTINVPVFEAGEYIRVIARLRYRRNGNGLAWGYQLVDPQKAFRGALEAMAESIKKETTQPVLFGSPEA